MSTLIHNLKEPFSTTFGMLLFIALGINFFTLYPRELSAMEIIGALIVAGILAFGNPKTFFNRLGKGATEKIFPEKQS